MKKLKTWHIVAIILALLLILFYFKPFKGNKQKPAGQSGPKLSGKKLSTKIDTTPPPVVLPQTADLIDEPIINEPPASAPKMAENHSSEFMYADNYA